MKTFRSVLVAAALALSSPAQASIIYDFVQTSAGGGSNNVLAGVRMQLTLSDDAAGMSSIFYQQIGNNPYSGPIVTGTGVEQFTWGMIGIANSGFFGRLPMGYYGSRFTAELTALIGGGLGGSIWYGSGNHDDVRLAYNPSTGLWTNSFIASDYPSPCHSTINTCTFSGYFVRAVPEPAGLALVALPLLLAWRLRPTK